MQKNTQPIQEDHQDNQKDWDKDVYHPLQSWDWGNFRKKMGIDVVRFTTDPDGKTPQQCQLTFHTIPHTLFTVGYVPKGPMPDKQMIKELIKLGKQKNAVYIQLEPNVMKGMEIPVSSLVRSHHPMFTKFTFIIDLTKSEEELLARMHPKTRYNIKVAEKHGVIIREDSSDHAFEEYLKLSSETTQRQGFYAHNEAYHREMWRTLSKAGIAKLWTATFNGETLASWILFLWKDTIYYPYGASSRNHREVMAPNLLLWEIAKWGKAHGFKKFDLWGALGGNPDPKDPWYGFHRFKEGYRPELVEYVGSYDLIINPLLYSLYCVADTIRWNILKIRKKF